MSRIRLADTITDLLNEMDKSVHDYNRLETIAISGLRILNLDVYGNIKTKVIDVHSHKKAHFPSDCVNYIKIGVLNEQGEIATFTRNNNLSTSNGCTTPEQFNSSPYLYDYQNFDILSNTRNVYFGMGSDVNIGEFNIDREDNSIVFGQGFGYSQVVIEYLSNQIDEDGEYYLDERLEEAVKAFTYWTAIKRIRVTTQAEKRDAKNEWLIEKRKAKARVSPIRSTEMNDISRQSLKLAIKH